MYDEGDDRFVPTTSVYPWAGTTIRNVLSIPDTSLFLCRQDSTIFWTTPQGKTAFEVPVKASQGMEGEGYGRVVPLDLAYVAFCRKNGCALLPHTELDRRVKTISPPGIRMIAYRDDSAADQQFRGTEVPVPYSLAYDQSNLLITFSTPCPEV